MGKKNSSKRPHPKHTKRKTGGGIGIAAESFQFPSIIVGHFVPFSNLLPYFMMKVREGGVEHADELFESFQVYRKIVSGKVSPFPKILNRRLTPSYRSSF